jgi:hypothetical protein
MSEAAQAFAQDFDIDPYARRVHRTYAEVLAQYELTHASGATRARRKDS